jgi:hypothetical protein
MSGEATDLEDGENFPSSWGEPPQRGTLARVEWLRGHILEAGGRVAVHYGEENRLSVGAGYRLPDGGYRSGYGGRTLPGRLARQLVELARLSEETTTTMSGMVARRALERQYAGPLTAGGGALGSNTGGSLLAGPLPAHSTPVSDATWAGSQPNVDRLGVNPSHSKMSAVHAWSDPASGLYLFGHHEVDAGGRVGPANVQAAKLHIQRLNDPKRQVIPAGDRGGTYAHLARHLRDAGRPVPDLVDLT